MQQVGLYIFSSLSRHNHSVSSTIQVLSFFAFFFVCYQQINCVLYGIQFDIAMHFVNAYRMISWLALAGVVDKCKYINGDNLEHFTYK